MNKKFIDIIAINRVLQGIKIELDKGYSTKHNLLDVLEATKKINGANIKLVNTEGATISKLFDGTADIAISASEIGANTKSEDIALLVGKVDKLEGKRLSTEDYTTIEKGKLAAIDANANNYTHPSTHSATEIVTDSNRGFVTDIEKVSWTDKYTKSETDAKIAVMTDAIEWKAAVATFDDIAIVYPEPQDGWVVNVNDTDITYRYTGSEWIEISANAIPVATTAVDGKMSKTDKAKLDAVEVGANLYVHPENHPATMITQKSTHRFVTDAEKTGWADKKTKNELDITLPTKVDISTSATVDDIDSMFDTLFPKPSTFLILTINNTASAIDLTKCLKSWKSIKFNGEVVETIPGSTAGTIEIENAVALDVYGYPNIFSEAFSSALTTFEGHLDTRNVTSTVNMFNGCTSLTSLNVSSFDTSNVTNMGNMFYRCTSLTSLDLSNFNTSKVSGMGMINMFVDCNSLLSIDLSSFDTSNVTDMSGIFERCAKITTLDLSNFNTSKLSRYGFYSLFRGCNSLTTVRISNFDMTNANGGGMFDTCISLKDIYLDGSKITKDDVVKISDILDTAYLLQPKTIYVSSHDKHEGLSYSNITYDCGGCPDVGGPKVLTLEIDNTASTIDLTKFLKSWGKVKFNGEVVESIPGNTAGTIEIENAVGLDVYDYANRFPMNTIRVLGYLDLSKCTSLESLFEYCGGLTTADLSEWEIKADNTKSMFDRCRALVAPVFNPNIVIKPVRLQSMISNCDRLNNLDLSMFDFSSAIYYSDVFKYCNALKNITALGRNKASNNKLGDIIQKYAPSTVTVMVDNPAAHDGLNYSKVVWVYPS